MPDPTPVAPAPGRWRLEPNPEWDHPPIDVEVAPDGLTMTRDDLPGAVYARDTAFVMVRELGEDWSSGFVCFGGTYRHYAQRTGYPSITLSEGTCGPAPGGRAAAVMIR